VVVLVAAFAGCQWKQANKDAKQATSDATARLHDNVAQSLLSSAQEMLMDVYPGGGSDVRAMQMVLAAHSFSSQFQNAPYYALSALQQERDLIKISEQPWMAFQVALSPDGNTIVAAGMGGTVRQLDSATLKEQPLDGHKYDVRAVAYSHDGTHRA
jgi:WD40 repeat protein